MRWLIFLVLFVPGIVPNALGQRPHLSRKPPVAEESDTKQVSITGVVNQSEASSLIIEATDQRILTFKITRTTHMPPAALLPGDHVRVEATQDAEAYLTANEVSIDKSYVGPAPEKAAANGNATTVASSKPADPVIYKPAKPDPDDEGPPRLRHGQKNPQPAKPLPPDTDPVLTSAVEGDSKPALPPEEPSIGETVVAPSAAPSAAAPNSSPNAALIDRAREWALTFTSTLPNYVCQQFTTRYLKPPGQRDWQAKDVVSANVVYENGKEDYRNIAINGKPQSKKMEELPGSWSTGEFGTTLRSLFHPGRRADFRYVKATQITGMTASVYDYSVKREYSDWRVQLGGQSIIPAYSGRVWIDQKTARVIRIEMHADDIPKEFPLDQVEASNDYGLIRLATADQYMLPLHAETLSCERGSTFCSRNAIEFRNYHKYSGEANITFQ